MSQTRPRPSTHQILRALDDFYRVGDMESFSATTQKYHITQDVYVAHLELKADLAKHSTETCNEYHEIQPQATRFGMK